MHSSKATIVCLLLAAPLVQAHSWVEKLNVIAPNGTFVGPDGFARGNVQRGEGFSDAKLVHLIRGAPTDPMCRDSQKSTSSQTPGNPRLNAPAGAAVAVRYQENGHVSLPDSPVGKAKNRGDVYIYGTTQPKDNELFNEVHGQWTADGKGGDGRGILLLKADYDDGQCYQVNGGAISQERQKEFGHPIAKDQGMDLWCQNDFRLPVDAPSGKAYTLYWVWDWPTEANVDAGLLNGMNETYTTCIDVDIAESSGSNKATEETYSFAEGQDLANAAVAKQFADLADPPVGNGQPAATSASESQSSSQSSTQSSSQSSTQSSIQSSAQSSTQSSAQSSTQSSAQSSTQASATSSTSASISIAPIPAPETSSSTSQEPSTTSSSPSAASSVEGAAGDASFSVAPIPGTDASQTGADTGKAITSDAPMGPAATVTITDLVITTMTTAPQFSNMVVPVNPQPTTMKTVVRR